MILCMLLVFISYGIKKLFTALYGYSTILATLIVIGLPVVVSTSYLLN